MQDVTSNEYTSHKVVLSEIDECLSRIDAGQVDDLADAIVEAEQIIVVGAGRMGLVLESFSARLNHLGFKSHVAGSLNCPPIAEGDLLLVASSSGETPTVREIAIKASKFAAGIFLITANTESTMARLSTGVLFMEAPSSIEQSETDALKSVQPMKTLFEQSLFILLESLVLRLMERTRQKADDLARRHANLE